jgi:DDE superfamily endonuclease
MANGFDTDLWTRERITVVIAQLTGVRHHPGHVVGDPAPSPRLDAAAALGGGPANATRTPSPAGWPRSGRGSKRGAAETAWIVFFDESAVSLIPPMRRTWSPRGHTPILRHRFGWKKASMAAALGYRPDGSAARLYFHLQQPSYNTDRLIGVLEQLAGFYTGQRVVLIWDGLSAHWSTRMRAWLDSQHDWLTAERLPAYAPELNPGRIPVGQPQGHGASESAHDHPGRGRRRHRTGHPTSLQAPGPGGRVLGSHRPHPRPMNRQPNPRNSITKEVRQFR